MLVNQPSAKPTRKIAAMIIATFVIQGLLGVAEYLLPGISEAIPAQEWVVSTAILLTGYMTKERAQ